MKLGKFGVWSSFDDLTSAQGSTFAKQIEQWGYPAVWLPEGFGRDVIAQSAWLLANTSSLIVAPGIANIYGRDPMMMHAGQMGLNEQSGGRFLLGVGVSHKMIVNDYRGHQYGKPIETMRSYLAAMKTAPFMAPVPAAAPKIVVAALGPQMLALARDHADGAHPYNVSPAHTAEARKILGPNKLLCVEQKVILETNPDRAREAGRKMINLYLPMPNYTNNWLRMGYTQDDFVNGASDRLVDGMVAWGDEAAIVKRIEQHWEAGADHVCIHSLHADHADTEKLLAKLARLNH